MYSFLLAAHSLFRWLVLISLVYTLFRAFRGLATNKKFSAFDNMIRHTSATIAHIQLLLGITLYYISPVIRYFLSHYSEAVEDRPVRFFGMEHSTMMLTAVILITIGSFRAKRRPTDKQKFRTIAIWYSIALLIILINIPWPFSPFSARPWIRGF
ncbi:hypothetical protein ACTHGU_05335 [Chitinophagaceae bacterium MMS25-I14]